MIVRLLISLLLVCCLTGRPAEADPLPFSGVWEGTSTGGDNANWTARIDANGRVTATGFSASIGTFTGTGSVSPSGELSVRFQGSTNSTVPGDRILARSIDLSARVTSSDRVAGTWRLNPRTLEFVTRPGDIPTGQFSARRTDATPIPGECEHLFGGRRPAPPAGFGVAYDPFDASKPLLIRAQRCGSIIIGSDASTQQIFRYAYVVRGGRWEQVNLRGRQPANPDPAGNWIEGSATATITPTSDVTYVIAYICTLVGNTWRCGCTDDACSGSAWQLQGIRRR